MPQFCKAQCTLGVSNKKIAGMQKGRKMHILQRERVRITREKNTEIARGENELTGVSEQLICPHVQNVRRKTQAYRDMHRMDFKNTCKDVNQLCRFKICKDR